MLGQEGRLLSFFFDPDFVRAAGFKPTEGGARMARQKLKDVEASHAFVSEEVHEYLSRKNKPLNTQVYLLEEGWAKRSYPPFYSYYFLKFSFSNNHDEMLQLVKKELADLEAGRDHFTTIKKSIAAREACLARLLRGTMGLTT
jgi:hypothetical protein